jgi:hypothetical protein
MTLRKIISGGQTGADRAALDAARAWNVPIGGWVPAGRAAEDGAIPAEYIELRETDTRLPEERTRLNVQDSDGTLIRRITLEQLRQCVELQRPAHGSTFEVQGEHVAACAPVGWPDISKIGKRRQRQLATQGVVGFRECRSTSASSSQPCADDTRRTFEFSTRRGLPHD